MKRLLLMLLVVLVALSACRTYSDEDRANFDKQIKEYLSRKGISCQRSSSGLYYKILAPGEGEYIRYKDMVSFTYKGEFLDGSVFDEQKEPVEFRVDQLIGGWKEVMFELKPGAKVFMVLPPQLGYGDRDLEDIPSNSILVYEMEIMAVK